MKYMFASDIHGSAYYCRKMLDAFEKSGAERLILLGDILYHGPRNDLPREYAPKEVIAMLNEKRDRIYAIRGNCDCEVDQMVLEFPIMADYALVEWNGLTLFATHGHRYNETCPPPMADGTILLNGHFHVPACADHEWYTYINPGSTSLPKNGSVGSYLILEDRTFTWKDMDGNAYKSYTIK